MINFAAGQPIGPTVIKALQDKITSLCDQLGAEYNRVECQSLEGKIDDSECIEIPNPLASLAENNAGVIDEKMIAFTLSPNVSFAIPGSEENNPPTGVRWTVTIKCGGNVVHVESGSDNELTLVEAFIDCPRNDKIEICFDSELVGGSVFADLVSDAQYCGAMICIGSEVRTLDGLFKPPEIPEGCCYGRENLCLASQNLDALCRSLLKNKSQFAYCVQGSSSQIDSILLASTLPTDTTFFAWGDVFICYRNNSYEREWFLRVDPVVGCDSDSSSCLGLRKSVRRNPSEGQPVGITQCATIPVIACGSCPAGESIYAGLTSDQICSPDVITAVGSGDLEIISVEQSYCVWLFSDTQIDNLPPATDLALGSCPTDAALLPLQEKCETLQEIIQAQTSPNFTPHDIAPLSGESPQDWTIQAAQPWPPAIPPPRPIPDPPPVKKWNMNVKICSALTEQQRSTLISASRAEGTLKLEIKCGGVVLVSRETSWLINQIEGSDFDGVQDFKERCLGFSDCIECRIDEDLRICGEFSVTGLGSPGIVNLETAKIFCF